MNTKRFKNDRRHIIKHKETQKDFKRATEGLKKRRKNVKYKKGLQIQKEHKVMKKHHEDTHKQPQKNVKQLQKVSK